MKCNWRIQLFRIRKYVTDINYKFTVCPTISFIKRCLQKSQRQEKSKNILLWTILWRIPSPPSCSYWPQMANRNSLIPNTIYFITLTIILSPVVWYNFTVLWGRNSTFPFSQKKKKQQRNEGITFLKVTQCVTGHRTTENR